jgi:fructose-1-phosphate kinase PfkB-like protein
MKEMEETKKSIEIDGEIITVGDNIRWMNISLNVYRQGKVTDITDEGIFVTQDNRSHTKLHITPPYEDKRIFTIE